MLGKPRQSVPGRFANMKQGLGSHKRRESPPANQLHLGPSIHPPQKKQDSINTPVRFPLRGGDWGMAGMKKRVGGECQRKLKYIQDEIIRVIVRTVIIQVAAGWVARSPSASTAQQCESLPADILTRNNKLPADNRITWFPWRPWPASGPFPPYIQLLPKTTWVPGTGWKRGGQGLNAGQRARTKISILPQSGGGRDSLRKTACEDTKGKQKPVHGADTAPSTLPPHWEPLPSSVTHTPPAPSPHPHTPHNPGPHVCKATHAHSHQSRCHQQPGTQFILPTETAFPRLCDRESVNPGEGCKFLTVSLAQPAQLWTTELGHP